MFIKLLKENTNIDEDFIDTFFKKFKIVESRQKTRSLFLYNLWRAKDVEGGGDT